MKRLLKVTLLTLVAVVMLLVGAVIWIAHDEVFIERRIENYVSRLTGRSFDIGALDLVLGTRTQVRMDVVQIENPDWAAAPELIHVDKARVSLDLRKVLSGQVIIDSLVLDGVQLHLEKTDLGEVNWDLLPRGNKEKEQASGPRIQWRHLELTGFELTHETPAREVPLEFRVDRLVAEQGPDGRVDVSADGVVDAHPMKVEGFVDALGAFVDDDALEFELSATLGDTSLTSRGSLPDVKTGEGAQIGFEFSGPEIERWLRQAALPGFSTGPFEVRLDLDVTHQGVLKLDLDGDFGTLDIVADGRLDRLIDPSLADFSFTLSGPDLEALGTTLGVRKLPRVDYSVEAGVLLQDNTLQVRDLEAALDENRLSASGKIGPWPELTGTSLDVKAGGPDIREWGPLMRFEKWQPNPFSIDGRFFEKNGAVAFTGLTVSIGETTAELSGTLGKLPGLDGGELDLKLQTPGIRTVLDWSITDWIPPLPARLEGVIRRDPRGLGLGGVQVLFEESVVELDGLLALQTGINRRADRPKWAAVLTGSDLTARVDVSSLTEAGTWYGYEGLPDKPLSADITARLDDDGLTFEASKGRLGEMSWTISGSVPQIPALENMRADFTLDIPALRTLEFIDPPRDWPDQPAKLAGNIRVQEPGRALVEVKSELGVIDAQVDGLIPDLDAPGTMQFQVRLKIADVSLLQAYVDPFAEVSLPADPFALSFDLQRFPGLMQFSGIEANLGDGNLSGLVELKSGAIPEYTGTFRSRRLDLSWLPPLAASNESNQDQAEGEDVPRLFNDEPFRLLSIDPMRVHVELETGQVDLPSQKLASVRLGFTLVPDELRLDPVELLDNEGGKIAGKLVLQNISGKLRAEAQGSAVGFRLGLAAAADQDPSTYPPWDVEGQLSGIGASMHELASHASGNVKVIVSEGKIANSRINLLFSDIITELLVALNPFKKESPYTNVECAVMMVELSEGQAVVDPLIAQTDKMIITSNGTVKLDSEKLDLSFNTRPRKGLGLTTGVVINPFIKLGGTLTRPRINLDAAHAAVSSGAAVATYGLSLLGKSIFDRYFRGRNPCGKLVAELRAMEDENNAKP